MLLRNARARVRQRAREDLEADPARVAQPVVADQHPQHIEHGQIRATRRLAGEQPRVAAPAHARRLALDVEHVGLAQGLAHPLRVGCLHQEDLAHVDVPAHLGQAGAQHCVRVRDAARRRGRVRELAPADVERVDADPEVCTVDRDDQLVAARPSVDERAPAERLIRDPHHGRLLRAEVRHLPHVRHQHVPVPRDALGEEVRGDDHQVRPQRLADAEPHRQLLDALGVPRPVEQPLVVHERLKADDSQVARVAHLPDLLGREHLVGRRDAAGERLGEVLEVFVEQLDAVVVVGGGLVELLREAVHPGAPEGEGGDAASWEHAGGDGGRGCRSCGGCGGAERADWAVLTGLLLHGGGRGGINARVMWYEETPENRDYREELR